MTSKLFHFLVGAFAVFLTAKLVPGTEVTLFSSLLVAVVLGIINTFFKPIISLLALPINVLTLGLFSLIVNALLVLLTASIVPGFGVNGFLSALIFSVVLALINAFFGVGKKNSNV